MDWETQKQKAVRLATEAHDGVIRKFGMDKGKPYIVHPTRVAQAGAIHYGRLADYVPYLYLSEIDGAYSVYISHDVPEDRKDLWTVDSYSDELEFEDWQRVALDALTKRDEEDYHDFITRIVNAYYYKSQKGGMVAAIGKISDIEDNMVSLEKGSLRDKYRLARRVLILEIPELDKIFPL